MGKKATTDPTPKPASDDQLLARLIAAIGKSNAGTNERVWFENQCLAIKLDTLKRLPAFYADADLRELMRKFLANGKERRELRRQLAAMKYELGRIRHIRLKAAPTDAEGRLKLTGLTDPENIERAERAEEKDIATFLEMATDYRKDPIRKLAIEPFLVLLRDEDVISEDMVAPRELPLNRMINALLDFIGVDPKHRPASLRPIVRDIRDKYEKRPSRRPKG